MVTCIYAVSPLLLSCDYKGLNFELKACSFLSLITFAFEAFIHLYLFAGNGSSTGGRGSVVHFNAALHQVTAFFLSDSKMSLLCFNVANNALVHC